MTNGFCRQPAALTVCLAAGLAASLARCQSRDPAAPEDSGLDVSMVPDAEDAANDAMADAPGSSDARRDAGDLFACDQPIDCLVIQATCCWGAVVGEPVLAIRSDAADAWYADDCAGRTRTCTAPCFAEAAYPWVATCADARCTLIDLRTEPLTACATGADCVVVPGQCTDCSTPYACDFPLDYFAAVARSELAAYEAAVCGAGHVLPTCSAAARLETRCIAGRCEVVDPRP